MKPPPPQYSVYIDAALLPYVVWMWRHAPRAQPYRRRVEIAIRCCTILVILSYAAAVVAAHSR